jgi:uncharacterized protein YndB with AHSA1/START domain
MPLITVQAEAEIPAPPARVWALLRDFDSMPRWNATARASRIEDGPADRIGCRRVLTFDDGSVWTHRLTQLDDETMTIGYTIIDGPPEKRAAMRDYAATITIARGSAAETCRVRWDAQFEGDTLEMRPRAEAVLQAGLAGIARLFA